MHIQLLMVSLENSALGTAIAQSSWMFPTIETIHVLALVCVVGSIFWVDLRLLNIANRERSFTAIAEELLPFTWMAFFIAVVAGALMFASKATVYYANVPFRAKMVCIVLAGVNMAVFQVRTVRTVSGWDASSPPIGARVAAGLSIALWVSVVALGRWIGFTT